MRCRSRAGPTADGEERRERGLPGRARNDAGVRCLTPPHPSRRAFQALLRMRRGNRHLYRLDLLSPRAARGSKTELMDGVVFLHGLGLHALAFAPMAWRLRKAGYRTLALSYPSLLRDIGGCAEYLHPEISRFVKEIDGRASLRHPFDGRAGGAGLSQPPPAAESWPRGDAGAAEPRQRGRRSAARQSALSRRVRACGPAAHHACRRSIRCSAR